MTRQKREAVQTGQAGMTRQTRKTGQTGQELNNSDKTDRQDISNFAGFMFELQKSNFTVKLRIVPNLFLSFTIQEKLTDEYFETFRQTFG
jgi:hypothetical protein